MSGVALSLPAALPVAESTDLLARRPEAPEEAGVNGRKASAGA